MRQPPLSDDRGQSERNEDVEIEAGFLSIEISEACFERFLQRLRSSSASSNDNDLQVLGAASLDCVF